MRGRIVGAYYGLRGAHAVVMHALDPASVELRVKFSQVRQVSAQQFIRRQPEHLIVPIEVVRQVSDVATAVEFTRG